MGLFSWLFGKKKKKGKEKVENKGDSKVIVGNVNKPGTQPAAPHGAVVDPEEGEVQNPTAIAGSSKPLDKEENKSRDEKIVEERIEDAKKGNVKEPLEPKETSEKKTEKKPVASAKRKEKGKYEVFPEADFYKFRLKDNDDSILVVSQGYTSERGAKSGINTFKKNVKIGNFEITTDKNGYSHFTLYTKTGARIVAVGEFYDSLNDAKASVQSIKKFYDTSEIETLDALPEDEVREEKVNLKPIEEKKTGTYDVYEDDEEWFFRLVANNGETLLISQGYTSKSGCLSGLDTAKSAIEEGAFTVSRDKQNRYQFKLYGSNNQVLLTGQTYGSKDSVVSAIDSVRRFGLKADIEEQ